MIKAINYYVPIPYCSNQLESTHFETDVIQFNYNYLHCVIHKVIWTVFYTAQITLSLSQLTIETEGGLKLS